MPENPGWYKDPWSRFESRWFDGTAWTDLVEEAPGLPGVDPPGPLTPQFDATVLPVAETTTVTKWEQFRKLPIAGQVAVWCTIGFIMLLIAAGIVTLLNNDDSDSVSSDSLPSGSSSTTFFETTTTSTTTTVAAVVTGPPIVIPVTDPTTTMPETTVPVESSTTVESTTIVETTLAPTTTEAPATTAAPTTTAAPATTTTVAPTTTTTMPATTTSTTVPPVPENSSCDDTGDEGDEEAFNLLQANISRSDHTEYIFVAEAGGTGDEDNVIYEFSVGSAYTVVGGLNGGADEAYVEDTKPATANYLIPEDDREIATGKVTLTIPNAALSDVAGEAFDWTIKLFVEGVERDSCTVEDFKITDSTTP